MNYFFGIKNSQFSSELQIPLFQNKTSKNENIFLYKAWIKKNCWEFCQVNKSDITDDFYVVNSEEVDNESIFFLAYKKDWTKFDNSKLTNLNNFTDTHPSFRANLKIILKNGGFSSYQSEYPYGMISKKGSILSSVSSITNINAEKNYIFIKNIYESPIEKSFNAYLVDIRNKKILETIGIKTNFSNFFELKKSLIKLEIFLVTGDFLGIPMYISVDNKHVSFEHTHPPHEYILSENKFSKVSNLKKEINEIIN